jgi:hypothetical protein
VQATAASDRTLRLGLGILWLLDGLLQMQPGMFTMDMVSTIMQPAATGQPGWLQSLITWSIRLVTPHLVAFNWGVVAIQLLTGLLLLLPGSGLQRAGLWLSVIWGAIVWLFGEGLGQVLTGSATFLTGAPGSAFFYALFAFILLLWPRTGTASDKGLDRFGQVVAWSLVLAALLQFSPVFFTGLGLASPFASAAMMQQPLAVRHLLDGAANFAAQVPMALNIAFIAVFALSALWLYLRPRSPWPYVTAATLLLLVWVFGQDAGMFWSGMSTDPNTAPVLVLALLAAWRGRPHTWFSHLS